MSSGGSDPLLALFSQRAIDFVIRALVRLGAPAQDLEDLAQDVMVIAVGRFASFDRSRALEPWLWGIARNRLRDYRDLARHRVEVGSEHAPSEALAAPQVAADGLLARRLHAALGALPEEQQIVVVLHDLESWTLPECAGALGVTVDVAKYRLAGARQSLRKRLAPKDTVAGHG
jgi:RNA polymerase sigma-70 factor (ECF subfamily)